MAQYLHERKEDAYSTMQGYYRHTKRQEERTRKEGINIRTGQMNERSRSSSGADITEQGCSSSEADR